MAGAGLSAMPWSTAWNTACDAVISANTTITGMNTNVSDVETALNGLVADIGADGVGLTAIPSDWTATEREQIRDALGINGTKTTAAVGGQLQSLVADIGANGIGLTAIPWATAWTTAVDGAISANATIAGINTNVNDVEAAIGVAGAGLSAMPWSTAWNTACDAVISANTTITGMNTNVNDVETALNALVTDIGPNGQGLTEIPSAGGSSDWTASEREQIRDALGITGTKTTVAVGGQLQSLITTVGIDGTGLDNIPWNQNWDIEVENECAAACATAIGAALGSGGASLTAIPWNQNWDAEVQSECSDALYLLNLDQLFLTPYDPLTDFGSSLGWCNQLVSHVSGSTPSRTQLTTEALALAPTGGGGGGGEADWTDSERAQIRYALGISGSASTTIGGTLNSILSTTVTTIGTIEMARNDIMAAVSGAVGFFDERFDEVVVASSTDWTDSEKAQIRTALGVSGSALPTDTGELQQLNEHISTTMAGTYGAIEDSIGLVSADITNIMSAMELSAGNYRFTTEALALAPAGGGGGGTTDWTASEREQIRDALGIDGTKTTIAVGGQLQGMADQMTTMAAVTDSVVADVTNSVWTADLSLPQYKVVSSPAAALAHITNFQIITDRLHVYWPDGSEAWEAIITTSPAGDITQVRKV